MIGVNRGKEGKIRGLSLFILVMLATPLRAEQFVYDSHGKRDPMAPLIAKEKAVAGGVVALSEITSIDDVKLEGITSQSSGVKMAIINGELIKENFKSGEFTLKKIMKKSVVLSISGQEYTVLLPEEGEKKSEK